MKKIVAGFLIAGGLLALTNPGMDAFRPFVKDVAQNKIEEATGGGLVGSVLGGAGSELVAANVDAITTRTSYLVCSTYEVDPDGDGVAEWRFLGVATRFVTLERPKLRGR